LGPYYSDVGRPSIDPELMMRMLIVGYCFGIRSERRLCEEVHLNLAYRWFCRLGLDADVPDHSTFSKNRHGRFRESDLLRKLFETVVARCMKEGIVGGEAFAVDASMIVADAHRRRGVAKIEDLDPTSSRAVAKYLSVLDDAAFGGATPVEPKLLSPTDPAARYTASANSLAGYAYSDNYLIDLKKAVIMDVEGTRAAPRAFHRSRRLDDVWIWKMRLLLALIVIVYLVGVGVVLSPVIRATWNTEPASVVAGDIGQALPDALAWPVRAAHAVTGS
jgi:transposase